MGLLDDLKQQADSLRQKQQVTQAELNENLRAAHARLKDGLHYLVDLFNSLNIIKPVVPRYYYLEGGVTKLENLLQCDYNCNGRRLTVDHHDFIEAIVLRFRCVGDGQITIEKQSEPMVQRLRDHLWTHALKFDVNEVKNERGYVERGIFTVKCEVPVTVTIGSDLENAQIKITLKNLEKLGEYVYVYDFDEFGKEVLEELGKVIIAKPNTFRTTGRRQQAMATTTNVRSVRMEPAAAPEPVPQPVADATDGQAKGLMNNLKSLLKR
ncbi:MAG: hypothetical protein JWN94_4722 [Betaproteobacteria bacterium]|nr:hypothetical protein [Betaproteobacteria bacterium]